MYEALVARVRYHIQKANFMGLKEAESTLLLNEAADAIEELKAGEKKFLCNISAIETENENLKRERRWIPVTERLPEPFETVLVCYQREGRYGTSCGHYYLDRGTTIWKASGIIPTHWMPLPEPPKEET